MNARLRELATLKPNPKRRAEAERYLDHKWEGVQTVAARTLGAWGGPESIAPLRRWLADLYERPYAWAAQGVALAELARCITEDDADWIFELFFSREREVERLVIFRAVLALPRELIRQRLEAETCHADPARRAAAERGLVWLSNQP